MVRTRSLRWWCVAICGAWVPISPESSTAARRTRHCVEEVQDLYLCDWIIDSKALAVPVVAFANADGGVIAIGVLNPILLHCLPLPFPLKKKQGQ